jgi:hypothetical protein
MVAHFCKPEISIYVTIGSKGIIGDVIVPHQDIIIPKVVMKTRETTSIEVAVFYDNVSGMVKTYNPSGAILFFRITRDEMFHVEIVQYDVIATGKPHDVLIEGVAINVNASSPFYNRIIRSDRYFSFIISSRVYKDINTIMFVFSIEECS